MKKRLLAAFVCLCMIVSMLPTMAFAETGAQETENVAAAVQKQIDTLPIAEELQTMTKEEQNAVYADLQAAYDAYEALTDKQKAAITGAEILESLFAVFAGMTNILSGTLVEEQFSTLDPGKTYWFDLSDEGILGAVNTGNSDGAVSVPDTTLTWVPFTYAGTVNAYKLESEQATTEEYAKENAYDHSLFIADYAMTHTVSWDDLNAADKNMIFGKDYQSGSVSYTLRAPSVGSTRNGYSESMRGIPQNNEWDAILDKNSGYIKNWSGLYSWGQDTYLNNASNRTMRGFRFACTSNNYYASNRVMNVGFRPVLELPDKLGSDDLSVVAVDLNGGKIGSIEGTVNIVVKSGEDFTAPSNDGLTRPDGNTDIYFAWLGSDGNTYTPGESVPAVVTKLTAQWGGPQFPTFVPGKIYWFDLSDEDIPGMVNGSVPDTTLTWVPFTYVGTINAYSREEAGVSTEDSVSPYDHSLFIADYAVTHTVSWDDLNAADKNMIFGKDYQSGSVDYTLRAPSAGSSYTVYGDSQHVIPQNNEWDAILDRNSGYIKNWSGLYSWGQDTYSSTSESSRAMRGSYSARSYGSNTSSYRDVLFGFRPVLEPPATLGSDGLNVVAVDLNGGRIGTTEGPVNIIVKSGAGFTAPSSDGLTRPAGNDGDSFAWLGSDGKTYAPGGNVPAEVTKLTAQWGEAPVEEQYTVTFEANGGNVSPSSATTKDGMLESLPTPTYNGYDFLGWYTEKDGGEKVTTDTVFREDTTIYAHWQKQAAQEYTVTFDANGGSVSQNSAQTTNWKLASLPTPTYDGYTFLGWYTQKDGGEKVTTDTVFTNDTTIYAHWQEQAAQDYTVTFNANGGNVSQNSAQTTNGKLASLPTPTFDGYDFLGWYTQKDGGEKVTTDTVFTNDTTIYAHWQEQIANTYSITVTNDGNGEASADKATAAEGETVTLTATPKSGYHFERWDVVSGGVTIDNNTFTMPAESVAIKAIFARNSIVIPPVDPPTVSKKTIDAIQDAEPGETVTVDLSRDSTKLDKEVFETLAGKDVTLAIDLGDGVSWTVNGTDIPEDADFVDIDLGVTMGSDGIPVDLINAITGEHGSVQMTLAHDGAFGFTMTLTAPVGEENAGCWANLYHFDEDADEMIFETAAQIDDDGSVSLPLSHANQYAIVIDDHNHGVIDLPFTDVSDSDWFYDPVCYVYSQGLMTGTSATTFEPNTSLSRAMLVAVLHRLEGSPAASGSDFTDVASGDWYAQAVNWAASVGVVNGFDDGTFQPNTAITREQLAVILRNYAEYKGLDISASGDLAHYTDADSVSDWAKESVEWMVGSGLLGGYEDSTLRPQGTTTRAEVASVLQRYLAN